MRSDTNRGGSLGPRRGPGEGLGGDSDVALEAVRGALLAYRPRAFQEAQLRRMVEDQLSALEERGHGGQPTGGLGTEEEARAQQRIARRRRRIVERLETEGLLQPVQLLPEDPKYRPLERTLVVGCTPLELGSTLAGRGYFTHASAVLLHGLTDSVPTTFYVNKEQSPKPRPSGKLTQDRLLRAFQGKQRRSNYVFRWGDQRFTLLAGKQTNDFGVEEQIGPSGETLRVTNLERTLVDIVVRPAYSGGLVEVLEAYKGAVKQGIDLGALIATLQHLDYIYPYHQVIGYLLQRVGVDSRSLEPLRALGLKFEMPAAHGMIQPQLDSAWKVWVPQGF